MLNSNEIRTNGPLPEGFENHPDGEAVKYHTSGNKDGNAPSVNFRGKLGGGPGRGMAQVVEKPADAKKTLIRLLVYFQQAKKLLALLLISVVCVTLVALAAPSLQGQAIEAA